MYLFKDSLLCPLILKSETNSLVPFAIATLCSYVYTGCMLAMQRKFYQIVFLCTLPESLSNLQESQGLISATLFCLYLFLKKEIGFQFYLKVARMVQLIYQKTK